MTTTPPLPRASDQAYERTLFEATEIAYWQSQQPAHADPLTDKEKAYLLRPSIWDKTSYEACDGRWQGWQWRAAIAHSAAQAPEGDTWQGAPSDYVLMPKRLTAENGAKAALSGEFKESVEVTCPTCDGSGDDPDFDGDPTEHGSACLECNGDGTVAQNVPVSWDTIKDIYKAAVALLATPAAPTCTPADERAPETTSERLRLIASSGDKGLIDAVVSGTISIKDAAEKLLARAAQGAGTAPAVPDNEELEKLWEDHGGHPADFGAAVLERWGGWQEGLLGYGGKLNVEAIDPVPVSTAENLLAELRQYAPDDNGIMRDAEPSPINSRYFDVHEAERAFAAPVSTAAAPTCKPAQAGPEPICSPNCFWGDCPPCVAAGLVAAPKACTGCDPAEGFCRARREAERNAAPEAPATEQQGELPRQIDAALFNWANAVKCGNSDDRARTRAVMIAAINGAIARAPSRAADGQQGASRAGPDWPHGPDEVACSSCGLTMGESRLLADLKRGDAAIARAPLPAQDAVAFTAQEAQALNDFIPKKWIAWRMTAKMFLSGNEIDELERKLATQSRAQSDTTGGSDA